MPPEITLPDNSFESGGVGWTFHGTANSPPGAAGVIANGDPINAGGAAAPDGVRCAYITQNGSALCPFTCPATGLWRLRIWASAATDSDPYVSGWVTGDVFIDRGTVRVADAGAPNGAPFVHRTSDTFHLDAGAHVLCVAGYNQDTGWFDSDDVDPFGGGPLPGGWFGDPTARYAYTYLFDVVELIWESTDDGAPLPPGWVPPPDWIRLRHATGPVCWETNADVMRIKSVDVDQIVTPVPRAGSTPVDYAGRDPSSGVLAYFAPPAPPVAPDPAPPTDPPPTLPAPDPNQQCCSAAWLMEANLRDLYTALVGLVRSVAGIEGAGIGGALLGKIVKYMKSDLAVFGSLLSGLGFFETQMAVLLDTLDWATFPPLLFSQQEAIANAFYCCLVTQPRPIVVDTALLGCVKANLGLEGAFFSGDAITLLQACIDFIHLSYWQYLCNLGLLDTSTLCTFYPCPP